MQDNKRLNPANGWNNELAVPRSTSLKKNGRCQILAKQGFLSLKNVTSGLALLVYSSEFHLGVLFQLPPADTDQPSDVMSEDRSFAKSAMAMILTEFEALGVRKRDLVTYAIGGSAADGIPETSVSMVRRTVASHGLTLTSSDLGGSQRRSIWMDVATGRTIIRSEPLIKQAKPLVTPENAAAQPTMLHVAQHASSTAAS